MGEWGRSISLQFVTKNTRFRHSPVTHRCFTKGVAQLGGAGNDRIGWLPKDVLIRIGCMNKRLLIGTVGSAMVLLLTAGCAHHGGPHGHHQGGMKGHMDMSKHPMNTNMNSPLSMSVTLPEPDRKTAPPVSAGTGPHVPPAATASAEGAPSPSALPPHHNRMPIVRRYPSLT